MFALILFNYKTPNEVFFAKLFYKKAETASPAKLFYKKAENN